MAHRLGSITSNLAIGRIATVCPLKSSLSHRGPGLDPHLICGTFGFHKFSTSQLAVGLANFAQMYTSSVKWNVIIRHMMSIWHTDRQYWSAGGDRAQAQELNKYIS